MRTAIVPNIETLPMADDAERTFIGLAINEGALPPGELSTEDFGNFLYRDAYRAFAELDADGERIHPITAKGILERNGSTLTVAEMMAAATGVPFGTSPDPLIRQIRDAAERRRWIKALDGFARRLADRSIEPGEVIDRLKSLEIARAAGRAGGLEIEFLETVERRSISWLAPPLIPFGFFTLCDGIEGIGKTFAMLDLGRRLTSGLPMPFGGDPHEPSTVLLLSVEDSPEYVLRPRAEAMGADLARLAVLRGAFEFSERGFANLEETIRKFRIRFVIIDPIFSFTGRSDINSTADVRPITDRLNRIAAEHGIAIVGIRHVNKAKGFGDPRSAGAHSVAWLQGARSALIIGHDTNDKARRGIVQHKLNVGPESKKTYGFEIGDDGSFRWTGESSLTLDEMLSHRPNDSTEERTAKAAAIEFLQSELANGPKASTDLVNDAYAAGISKRTLDRAKDRLGVISVKMGQHWVWELKDANIANRF